MNKTKQYIYNVLSESKKASQRLISRLNDKISLLEYGRYVYNCNNCNIWSDALQMALNEHEVVVIPASEEVYYIDKTIVVPSNRRIEATGAVIRLTPECEVIMMRNEHTCDGTHMPINSEISDRNISINGGSWEESRNSRFGYGKTGKYDAERSFFGVSTLIFFDNAENLMFTNMKFTHTSGFAFQTGNIKNAVFENIRFSECFADGLHINGNCENIIVRDVKGQVADDLVALNMYDWQNSSVCFGPTKNILVEDIELSADSECKAIRIEPGIYYYDDGSFVDCALENAIIRNVSGIETFKLYFQTPPYKINATLPEKGGIGSANNIFFEDMNIDLSRPAEYFFEEYANSDTVKGHFGIFEICSNIDYICFENINIILHRDIYPLSHMVNVGPKSCRGGDIEYFDPYLSSTVRCMEFNNVTINGKCAFDIDLLVHNTEFCDVNNDGMSTAKGIVEKIILNSKIIFMQDKN